MDEDRDLLEKQEADRLNTSPEDIAKAERLWQSMNETTGEAKLFPGGQIQQALAICSAQMAQEDPDQLIPCCCHGEYWPSRDVDM